MDNSRNSRNRTRRQFLRRAATAGGMVAFATQVPRLMAQPVAGEDRPESAPGHAYRETEHVRKYYETARR
jgi:hypothetical protein